MRKLSKFAKPIIIVMSILLAGSMLYAQFARAESTAELAPWQSITKEDWRLDDKALLQRAIEGSNFDSLTKAADKGNANALFIIALAYRTGEFGLQGMIFEQEDYLIKSCEAGQPIACGELGNIYQYGDYGFEVDTQKAIKYTRLACDGGEAWACSNLASHYKIGDGVPKNLNTAVTLWTAACKADDSIGCSEMSKAHKFGWSVEIDPALEKKYQEKACKLDKNMC